MARTVGVTVGGFKTDPVVPPPPPPPPPSTRFAGDPGVGNYYLGMSPNTSSIATHESKMGGPLGMIRTFATGDTPPWSDVDSIINGQRIPWMSWRNGSKTVTDIANGVYDAWIDGIAAQIAARAPWPIWWTFMHEPENDSTTGGTPFNATLLASYRLAQRRIKTRFRAAGLTNDTFACVCFMTPFTFNEAQSGRDWRQFYPDWRNATGLGTAANPDPNDFYLDGDPNSVVDVIGIDFYHGWDLSDGLTKWNNTTAQGVWSRYGSRTSFLGKAYGVGEWATMAAQDNVNIDPNHDGHFLITEYTPQIGTINYRPDLTNQWIDDYFGNRLNGTVAFCYWDSQTIPIGEVAANPLSIADPNETRWARLGVWANGVNARLWTVNGAVAP